MDYKFIRPLQERAKELQCLYDIENVLSDEKKDFHYIFNKIVDIIPNGWQFPPFCHAIIELDDNLFYLQESDVPELSQTAELIVDNNIVGKIVVFYKDLPFTNEVFLAEEQKLLNTIANRLSIFIFNCRLRKTIKLLSEKKDIANEQNYLDDYKDEYWKWRFQMAQKIANKTDFKYYGIDAIYIIGSTKEATAGPASDIDLLVHFKGTEYQKNLFKSWIDGWNHSLSEFNRRKTGYKLEDGLIDLHIITDEDIEKKTSFAVMIGSANNPARLLKKGK
ncbi:MAG TPA: hypothetical protein DCG75_03480 [Bacteroidales bacterium]|jgi:predicted nucleotidyltransferase|nr:hypothetical protein [Bacteroidales bacterium]